MAYRKLMIRLSEMKFALGIKTRSALRWLLERKRDCIAPNPQHAPDLFKSIETEPTADDLAT